MFFELFYSYQQAIENIIMKMGAGMTKFMIKLKKKYKSALFCKASYYQYRKTTSLCFFTRMRFVYIFLGVNIHAYKFRHGDTIKKFCFLSYFCCVLSRLASFSDLSVDEHANSSQNQSKKRTRGHQNAKSSKILASNYFERI